MVVSMCTTLLDCHFTKRRGPGLRLFTSACWLTCSCLTSTGAWLSRSVPQQTVFLAFMYWYRFGPEYQLSINKWCPLPKTVSVIFSVAVTCAILSCPRQCQSSFQLQSHVQYCLGDTDKFENWDPLSLYKYWIISVATVFTNNEEFDAKSCPLQGNRLIEH